MTLTRTASQNWKNENVTRYHLDGVQISQEAFIQIVTAYSDWQERTERTAKGWRDVWTRAA